MIELKHLLENADQAFERLLLTNTDVQKAYAYADAAHSADDQRRKYTGAQYIEHPRMVAGLLLTVLPLDKAVVPVQAALLHDVVEDTCVTPEDLLRHFSGDVVELVEELTEPDDPHHWVKLGFESRPNRSMRRALEVDRRSTISDMGQTISVADMIANSQDIVNLAPHDFAKLYQVELSNRLDVLTRANPELVMIARNLLDHNLARLDAPREMNHAD
jgi:(p)ppGpp synthase/HD superfamily hydrolase